MVGVRVRQVLRGVTAGVVAVAMGVSLSGSAAAAPLALSPGDESDVVWEGPYAEQEAPVGGEAVEPREAVEHALPSSEVAAGQEVVGARTERSKTFAGQEPGVFETRLFTEPVHTAREGEWVEIDTGLVVGEEGRWVPQVAGVEVSFAPVADPVEMARVELPEGAGSIGWGLQGGARSTGAAGPERGLGVAASGRGAARAQVAEDVVRYEEVVPGVAVELSARAGGVKEDLVLADVSAPGVFFFDLDLEGVVAVESGGGVGFVNPAGEQVATVPAGFMVDAAGEISDGVQMALVGPGQDPVLKVQIDTTWLAQEGRVFPVVVDPVVQVTTGVADTHVESTRPGVNFAGHPYMRVGRDGNGRVARGFISFDVSALSGRTIDYADLRFTNRASLDCTARVVSAYRVTQGWVAADVRYPGPGYATAKVGEVSIGAGSSGCPAAQASMPISQVVRDWAAGTVANHGLALVGNEADAASMKLIEASDAADAAVRPYLLVSWRESLLGQLGYYTMNTAALSDRAQMGVNVANGNLFVQHVDLALSGTAGLGLDIGRYYNSREDTVNPARAGQTGAGWTLDVGSDVRLSVNGYDRSAFFEGPSGYRVVFPYDHAKGEYRQPAGLNARLLTGFRGHDRTVHMVDSGLYYHFSGKPSLSAISDQRGNTITMNYASNGERLVSITDTRGGVTTFERNGQGFVSKITDPFGRATTFAYDGDALVSVTDPAGKITRYEYDADANMSAFIDPRGGTTRYGYNGADELTSITWADSTTASPKVTTYDRAQETSIWMSDPNGSDEWGWKFDRQGRLEEFTSPRSGVPTKYAYDAFNSVTGYTNNTGGIGTIVYDGYNVTEFQSANGARSVFDYTGSGVEGRPSKFTNAQGVALDYRWDNSQEMTQVSQDGAVMAAMAYRTGAQACSGSLDRATDARGQVTTYSYDSRCRLTKVDRPAPMGDTSMTYDTLDRVRTVTDARGVVQTLSYDTLDRLTQVTYTGTGVSGTDRVSYSYDANGNRTTRTDTVPGQGTRSSTWTLDARNRVLSEVLPEGNNAYTYDKAGNLATLTNAWGTTSYAYDEENDVTSITPPVGPAVTIDRYEHTYAAVKFPNHVTDAQHYDTDGRIQQIDHYYNDPQVTGDHRQLTRQYLDYAGTDALHQITDPDFDYSLEYTYDSAGRIASSYGTSEGDIFEDNSYQYDANSNRTAWTWGSRGTTFSYTAAYNSADQLTSITQAAAGTTSYSYDTVGNQTGNSAGAQMSYDARGRATTIQHQYGGRGAEAAQYNGTSQVERTKIGGWTFTNSLLGVTSSTQAAEGTRHYLRTPDGRVLGEYRAKDNTWRYYLTNHQGSIIGATDPVGTQTESYGYGPYGEYQYGSGGGTDLIHWRYTGEWLDGTSVTGNGYYKIGLRYYDDTQGRWTQTDPAERVVNPTQPAEAQPYNYAGCNPTNQTDPTGAAVDWDCVAKGAGIGLAGGAAIGILLAGAGVFVPGIMSYMTVKGSLALGVFSRTLEGAAAGALFSQLGCD